MKPLYILIINLCAFALLAGISSCQYIFFDQPQPVGAKNLKEIPEEFRGVWSNIEKITDTLIISERSYTTIGHNSERWEYGASLSDTLLIRKARNGYVMNLKRGDWWEIVYVHKNKNGEIRIYYPSYEQMQALKDEVGYDSLAQKNDKARDITSSDSLYFHAEWTAKDIEKLFLQDSLVLPLYILQPDSIFLKINQIK